ncbi:MAG: alpha-L-fucosidase [Candidatus Hodarchaeota archaeon]
MKNLPTPSSAQLAWQEAELGALFHYDLSVFDGKIYNQGKNQRAAKSSLDIFNPTNLDCEQWVKVAKGMGARFAIITASHETGFRLWQSKVNKYSLSSTAWSDGKRDILREFHDACTKHGIEPGVYLGTRWNSQLGVESFMVTDRSPISQEEYNKLIEAEVEEVLSNYGKWFEVWFDGGAHGPDAGGPDLLPIFEKCQPDSLFYHNRQRADARWGGSESGTVPYPCWATFPYACTDSEVWKQQGWTGGNKEFFSLLGNGESNGTYWMPAMSDTPLRHHEWVWNPGDEKKIKPLKKLIDIYYKSVGHNSTLIVGLTPGIDGLVPDADASRCKEWGEAIKKLFSNPIIMMDQTEIEEKMKELNNGVYEIELVMMQKSAINQIIIQENVSTGERVRDYTIETCAKGKWNQVASGTCIGHKRIHRLKQKKAERLVIRINRATAKPELKTIAIYNSKV